MGQRLHHHGGITALADTDGDGSYSEEELNALTKAQLLGLAGELSVEGVNSKSTKAALVEAILASQA